MVFDSKSKYRAKVNSSVVALLNLLVVGYCVSIVLTFISMCVYIFSLFACKKTKSLLYS